MIYPQWRKLDRQTPFNLPPHGPVVFAAAVPENIEIEFVDANVSGLEFDDHPDLVCLSVMLTAQLPEALRIAAEYRERGVPVMAGGIAVMLHHEEIRSAVSSVFIGEAEGRMTQVAEDVRRGELKPVYDYMTNPVDIRLVGTARREILDREAYTYRNIRMVDLVHASRGCRFNCFPCCTGYLGGRVFRPRPIDRVVEEIESIDNEALFFVDNSLAQDTRWEEELFRALIPLKKRWVSHPIEENDRVLDLAYQAGCWYVYQAVFDTSQKIRQRIRRYHDHGIKVEATVILGTDEHDVDGIKRLVDFLQEVNLDLAEFTILTPFAHSPIRGKLLAEGRILSDRYEDYTCDRVVFRPLRMTPEQLREMFDYSWDAFYRHESQELKMGKLFISAFRRQNAGGKGMMARR
ncbi:MAG: radical SAM protein [Candidatus Aminicenantes bacterium RBG_13_62_12]|nr:MAG: radical SAM protein [Candidatus Aminicenantes bacterium RBG_13_62_12]